MKKGWDSKPFDECIYKLKSQVKIQKSDFWASGALPIVSQESGLINGYWNNASDACNVEPPVIVFGDHTRVVKYIDFSFVVGADGVKIIKVKPFIFAKYLYYYIIFSGIKSLGYARHYRILREIAVEFPSIDEQRRIVAILDDAFARIDKAIATTEKNIANTKELLEGFLGKYFHAQFEKYENLTFFSSDITDGDHQPPPKAERGVPFITIGNIDKNNNSIDFTNTFKVSEQYYSKLKENKKPRFGDILYTVTGSFGIPVLVETNTDFCFQRHIGLIRPLDTVSSGWLYYALRSRFICRQAEDAATGTAQKTVSLKALRAFKLPRLAPAEQEKIAQELFSIEAKIAELRATYEVKLASLRALKQSLLAAAFSGELTADFNPDALEL